jgi:hypothetical protein
MLISSSILSAPKVAITCTLGWTASDCTPANGNTISEAKMPNIKYSSEKYLKFNPEIPDAALRQAEAVSADYDRRAGEAGIALAGKVESVTNRARQQVRDLLGAEKWSQLRRQMRDERVRFRDLLQPPANATAEFDRLSASRKGSVEKLLNSLGANSGKLREIYRNATSEIARLRPSLKVKSGFATWLNTDHMTLLTRSAYQTFRPPYDGWQEGFNPTELGNFRVSRFHHRDENVGLVGHDLRLDNNDASDFDNGWADVDTQVSFWYLPPTTGIVEVIIEARSGRGLHELRVSDEWGTSDSSTSQENLLTMHVLHPNVSGASFGWISRFNWNTDNSTFQQREFVTPGGVYSAQLFTDGPVPANQWVLIRAGTRSSDASITNDMEINSLSVFKWFLQAVHVRIAS